MAARRAMLSVCALFVALAGGCYPVGRTVFPSSGETKCFLDVSGLCVKLTNVETEGNCDFELVQRDPDRDATLSSHVRVARRARVPVTFRGGAYEVEVASTTERVFHPDEAIFVLYGPR